MNEFDVAHGVMGAVGFGAYEAVRIYKKTGSGLPVYGITQGDRFVHTLVVIVLCAASGLIAGFWVGINMIQALYLGATFPMALSGVVSTSSNQSGSRLRKSPGIRGGQSQTVDDISDAGPTGIALFRSRVLDYF
jgi:hypothetical protein